MAKGMHPLMAELRDMSMSGEELGERCLPLALIVLSITLTEHTVCIPRSQPWLHESFGGHWEVWGGVMCLALLGVLPRQPHVMLHLG